MNKEEQNEGFAVDLDDNADRFFNVIDFETNWCLTTVCGKKHMMEMVITYCFGLGHNKNFQKQNMRTRVPSWLCRGMFERIVVTMKFN